MRNTTRTVALATIFATTLIATTASAVEPRVRDRRDQGNISVMVKRVMKFFGVSSLGAEMTIPTPNNTPSTKTGDN